MNSSLIKSRSLRRILGVVLLPVLVSSVWAHAFLDHAEPKVGSTIPPAPTEVKIWFTQNLEPAFSKIEVQDAQGNPVDKKDVHVDPKDKTLLIVSVNPLVAGTYTVTWNAVSVDTHKTQGHFDFTIKKPEGPTPPPH